MQFSIICTIWQVCDVRGDGEGGSAVELRLMYTPDAVESYQGRSSRWRHKGKAPAVDPVETEMAAECVAD